MVVVDMVGRLLHDVLNPQERETRRERLKWNT
jgi:hypothetical protein